MVKYIYKKLASFRAKPSILSKINLWNFLNFKKFKDTSLHILFTIKGLRFPKIKNISAFLDDPETERWLTFFGLFASIILVIILVFFF